MLPLLLASGMEAFNEVTMTESTVECCHLILTLAAPMLIAAILAQVIIAIFQAATQIQEQTMSFVPKIVFTFMAVLYYGPWISSEVIIFTMKTLNMIQLIGPHKGG